MRRIPQADRDACEAICATLTARGDKDSLEAAAMIRGTLTAYADLIETLDQVRSTLKDTRANFDNLMSVWSRVPSDIRIATAHGKAA